MGIARGAVAAVVGIVAAMGCVVLTDALAGALFPHDGPLPATPEEIAAFMERMPAGAHMTLAAGYTLAAGIGAVIAAALARGHPAPGLIAATFMVAAMSANYLSVPHPLWMVIGSLATASIAGVLGALYGATLTLGSRVEADRAG